MKEAHHDIYYSAGEISIAVPSSPFLESVRKKEVNIMLMVDPIDEYPM